MLDFPLMLHVKWSVVDIIHSLYKFTVLYFSECNYPDHNVSAYTKYLPKFAMGVENKAKLHDSA